MFNESKFTEPSETEQKETISNHESKLEALNQKINQKTDYVIEVKDVIFNNRNLSTEDFGNMLSDCFATWYSTCDQEMSQKIGQYFDIKEQLQQEAEGTDSESQTQEEFDKISNDSDVSFVEHMLQAQINLVSKRKKVEEYELLDEEDKKEKAALYVRDMLIHTNEISDEWLNNPQTLDMSGIEVVCNGISLDIYFSENNWMHAIKNAKLSSNGFHFPHTPINLILQRGDYDETENVRIHEEMHSIFQTLSLDYKYDGKVRDLMRSRVEEIAPIIRSAPDSDLAKQKRGELESYLLSFSDSLTDELFADIEIYRNTGKTPAYEVYITSQIRMSLAPYLRQGLPKDLGLDGKKIANEYERVYAETLQTLKEVYNIGLEHGILDKVQAAIVLFPNNIRKAKRFIDWVVKKKTGGED